MGLIKMIPKIDDIIRTSGIHPSRVFNVYIFGSRVYGTSSNDSDWMFWDKLKRGRWSWEMIEDEFKLLHNSVLSEFRKTTPKL